MKVSAIIETPPQRAKIDATNRRRDLKPANPSVDPLTRLDKIVHGLLGTGSGPSVTFVYEDENTREWARKVCERMVRIAGVEGVRASWWKINDLSVPGILAGALSTAVRADIIVVATRGEGLPLPFYVWVNLWWPHRPESAGALLSLTTECGSNSAGRGVGEYLEVVAHQARMEFLRTNQKTHNTGNGHTSPAANGWHHVNGNGHRFVNGKTHKVNGRNRK